MITKDHLINLCTQKYSLSLLVTTVWTLSCFPIIFNSLYQVGTAVCRSCGYVTTNIWEMSRRELYVLAYDKYPPTQPPSDSLRPLSSHQHPRALIPYRYPGPILRISWAYIDHIFAIYIGPVTFSKHFQHTLTISSLHLHNILTTPP